MTRREFMYLGTWALLATALRKTSQAQSQPTPAPAQLQVTGWAVPWEIDWHIGEQPVHHQYLPVIKNGNA